MTSEAVNALGSVLIRRSTRTASVVVTGTVDFSPDVGFFGCGVGGGVVIPRSPQAAATSSAVARRSRGVWGTMLVPYLLKPKGMNGSGQYPYQTRAQPTIFRPPL